MKNVLSLTIGATCMAVLSWAAQRPDKPAASERTERGRYLVDQVAKCSECHTPRTADGEEDLSRYLEGAPVWFTPNFQAPQNWAFRAPALAGLPGFTDADMTNILEKGLTPQGDPIRPPMHVYHMNHDDAVAVVAYLRSLRAGPSE